MNAYLLFIVILIIPEYISTESHYPKQSLVQYNTLIPVYDM